jgi:hypothetical protein
VTAAIKWYKEVRELFTELYPSVEVSKPVVKEKPVKAAKKAEEQMPMDLSDDDPI